MSYPTIPRIPPQPPEDWEEDLRAILTADLGDRPRLGELNIFTTFARHPELFKNWMQFARYLLVGGRLPFADRELLILRTGYNCRAPYEWGQHVRIAMNGGIEREVVDRVAAGADARISNATWEDLARHLDQQQLIELPMLVGQYHLVAFALNSLGVQPEPGLEPLP